MSSDAMVKAEPALLRMLRALGLAGVRDEATREPDHIAGADYAQGLPASHGFKPIDSLASIAVFPFVNAAMNAIATDLSALPLRVSVGKGRDSKPVEDHPIIDLLERPSSRTSGIQLRRQLVTDLVLTGDAFLSIFGLNEPEVLLRLHPGRMSIVPRPDGQVDHFVHSGVGASKRYEWEQVAHFRLTSWEDDPRGMYGNGAIRALATDLKTDKLAAELAANSAKHGRPTAVFSPADSDDVWSETQIKRLRAAYEKTTRSSGGALFLGSGAKMDPMSWSPRDLEFSKVREGVREAILAVFDVPPTRLGGNSANYATSKEQAKRYFEGLKGRSAIIDGELSRVAKMFPGWENSDVRVYHDFSGVDALAESRDARVGRVRSWSDMGIPLADAAAFEGFDDLPGQDVDEDVVSTGDGPATMGQPMAATALNGAQVASLLSIIGQVSGGLLTLDAAVALIGSAFPTVSEAQARRIVSGAMSPPPEPTPAAVKTAPVFVNRSASFDERSSAWDAFIEKSHGPAEHSIERALKAYMSEAAARTATRLKTELKKTAAPFVTRSEHEDVDIDSATLARVLDEVHEAELLEAAVAGPMKAAFSDAAVAAVKTLPSEWTAALAPVRTDEAALARIGQLVKDVQPYTADAVRDVMVKGLSEGASIADMQAAIQTSRGYTPARALRIATTEATTAVNAGTVEAYTAIADAGFPIKYEWISAKDKVVRDEHRQLDQHPPIAPGELFKIGDHSAPSPGQFASASMNVNCRCALLPVIDED